MITNELAAQLKEVGWYFNDWTPYESVGEMVVIDGLKFESPTIAEFIKAIPTFGRLRKWDDGNGVKWFASAGLCTNPEKDFWEFDKMGDTPEGALANLWITLNTKDA